MILLGLFTLLSCGSNNPPPPPSYASTLREWWAPFSELLSAEVAKGLGRSETERQEALKAWETTVHQLALLLAKTGMPLETFQAQYQDLTDRPEFSPIFLAPIKDDPWTPVLRTLLGDFDSMEQSIKIVEFRDAAAYLGRAATAALFALEGPSGSPPPDSPEGAARLGIRWMLDVSARLYSEVKGFSPFYDFPVEGPPSEKIEDRLAQTIEGTYRPDDTSEETDEVIWTAFVMRLLEEELRKEEIQRLEVIRKACPGNAYAALMQASSLFLAGRPREAVDRLNQSNAHRCNPHTLTIYRSLVQSLRGPLAPFTALRRLPTNHLHHLEALGSWLGEYAKERCSREECKETQTALDTVLDLLEAFDSCTFLRLERVSSARTRIPILRAKSFHEKTHGSDDARWLAERGLLRAMKAAVAIERSPLDDAMEILLMAQLPERDRQGGLNRFLTATATSERIGQALVALEQALSTAPDGDWSESVRTACRSQGRDAALLLCDEALANSSTDLEAIRMREWVVTQD